MALGGVEAPWPPSARDEAPAHHRTARALQALGLAELAGRHALPSAEGLDEGGDVGVAQAFGDFRVRQGGRGHELFGERGLHLCPHRAAVCGSAWGSGSCMSAAANTLRSWV